MNDAEDRARKTAELARREAEDLGDLGSMLVISDDDQYRSAGEALRQVLERVDQLEEKRKEITRPLDQAKKSVMDLFREPVDRFKAIASQIKGAMAAHVERQESERLRALEALADAEPEQARALVVSASHKTPPEASGIQTRQVWDFEVIDEDALPRECLSRDDKKIRALVKANEGRTNLPGVRVFLRTDVRRGK